MPPSAAKPVSGAHSPPQHAPQVGGSPANQVRSAELTDQHLAAAALMVWRLPSGLQLPDAKPFLLPLHVQVKSLHVHQKKKGLPTAER